MNVKEPLSPKQLIPNPGLRSHGSRSGLPNQLPLLNPPQLLSKFQSLLRPHPLAIAI